MTIYLFSVAFNPDSALNQSGSSEYCPAKADFSTSHEVNEGAGSEVTELDGSSIRAPYTSGRDAEDVLCSGPTRPGRQVSPEDAANAEETF